MIDDVADQWGGTGGPISGREWRAWAQLTRHLALMDSFEHQPGYLRYSWDSLRRHRHNPRNGLQPPGSRILRRLDRMYFTQRGEGFRGNARLRFSLVLLSLTTRRYGALYRLVTRC